MASSDGLEDKVGGHEADSEHTPDQHAGQPGATTEG